VTGRLQDEHQVARNWVEKHYPSATGTVKAMLILVFGAGLDRGMAEAHEILIEEARRAQ
jgi:hypothetical protein